MSPTDELGSFQAGRVTATQEWLETHGDGSFALGSTHGTLTRRYHGLLVAALAAPHGRTVMVSKLDESLIVGEHLVRTNGNVFVSSTHEGAAANRAFALDPLPRWEIEAGAATLERTVFAVHGERTTVVRYRQLSGPPCVLMLRPLCAMRHFHHLNHGLSASDFTLRLAHGRATVGRGGLPEVHVLHGGTFVADPCVWWNFRLPVEGERGLDDTEDLFCPGTIRVPLAAGESTYVVVTLDDARTYDLTQLDGLAVAERARRAELVRGFEDVDRDAAQLVRAADAYRVDVEGRRTIIAGYPWFEDWGRDTMLSLPGLFLALGRLDDAKRLLASWADELVGGLLPNRFGDRAHAPELNSVDAPLLFVEAVRAYLAYGGDPVFVDDALYPRLLEIVTRFAQGTFHGIRMDEDGLVIAASHGHALTWMDAVVDGRAITPRRGKPVEIQALWHSALLFVAARSHARGALFLASDLRGLARRVQASFVARFWDETRGHLADLVDPVEPPFPGAHHGPGTRDARLRPNQLFAVSLGQELVDHTQSERIVEAVRARLLTPRGLRTLAPGEPDYVGRYQGGPLARDGAYHQGTVWPWLLGPYVRALVVVHGSTESARAEVRTVLAPLLREATREDGIGQIAEIYDGDAPHRPAGCPAQAWSVAEVLRGWLDVVEQRTKATAKARPVFTPAALIPIAE